MKTKTALLAVSLLTTTLSAAFLAGAATAAAPSALRFGVGSEGYDELRAAGVHAPLSQFWVGAWTRHSGWGYVDNYLKIANNRGTVPVIEFWYWGDSITPHCIENGCWSTLSNAPISKKEWYDYAYTLAAKIRQHMGGREVIVVLETEFNKHGVGSYEPFDGYLADQARIFKSVPGVKVAIGFGNWGQSEWRNFDRAVGASDYTGFQLLRGSTHESWDAYTRAVDTIGTAAATLKSTFGKPVLLHDVSLSSYPEPNWMYAQDQVLKGMFSRLGELEGKGLQGVIYRSVRDNPNFDTRNYYGYAERYWGLKHHDASAKPGWWTWVNGIKAHGAAAPAPAPAPEPQPAPTTGGKAVPGTLEVESFATKSAGAAINDGGASGGKHWNLWSNGNVGDTVVAASSGEHTFTVRAKGTPANGVWPRMTLSVAGGQVGVWDVKSTGYLTYSAKVDLKAGEAVRVSLAFTNDLRTSTEDRNLLLDSLKVTAPAAPAPTGTLEGEAFGTRSVGTRVADGRASGGAHWLLWSNGHLADRVTTSGGPTTFTLKASGTPASGEWPLMALRVDGQVVGKWHVPSRDIWTYSVRHDLPAGTHDVRVEFWNDHRTSSEDRNLYVDALVMRAG